MFSNQTQSQNPFQSFPNGQIIQQTPSAGDRFVTDAMKVIQLATAVVTVVAMGCAIHQSFKPARDQKREG